MRDVLLAVGLYAFTRCLSYLQDVFAPFRKVQANKALRTKLLTFNDPDADPSTVADAGKHFLLAMFGVNNIEDRLCFDIFKKY